MSITHALEKARLELIDQGFRNPLINYRPLRAKGMVINDEIPQEIFNLLVVSGKPMDFLHDPAKDDQKTIATFGDEIGFEPIWYSPRIRDVRHYILWKYAVIEVTEETLAQPEESRFGTDETRHSDNHLQTGYSSKELQKRLIETADFARTVIEEQGINILFLALGELKWYEADISNEIRRAPLVLIPVEISRKNAQAKFTVKYTENGINGNLSLKEKLKSDFRLQLSLPENFTEEESDFKFEAYCDAVSEVVKLKERWTVDRDAISIGFFSFGKLLMLNDLIESNWPDDVQPSNHPILRALLGEGFSEEQVQIASLSREELDTYQSHLKNSHIVDADSSQTEAIHAVKKGKTLAIQGPPGTGKSQTIANIITEAVGDGKTVLFVAEKMAALDVVKRRLDKESVGDLCLELHSHKVNRKIVLAELQRTLYLTQPHAIDLQSGSEDHQRSRQKLNAHSVAVSKKIGQSGVTPYQTYGYLLQIKRRLQEVDLPKWRDEQVAQWKSADYEAALLEVQRLQRSLKILPYGLTTHPFWGVKLTSVTPITRDEVSKDAQTASKTVKMLTVAVNDLSAKLDITPPTNLLSIYALTRIIEVWGVIKMIQANDLHSEDWLKRTCDRLSEIDNIGRQFESVWKDLNDRVLPDSLQVDLTPIRAAVQGSQNWFKRLFGAGKKAQQALAKIFKTPPAPKTEFQLLDELEKAQRLAGQLKSEHDFASRLLGDVWGQTKTDWRKLGIVLETLQTIQEASKHPESDTDVYEKIAQWKLTGDIREVAREVVKQRETLIKQLDDLCKVLEMDASVGFGGIGIHRYTLTKLQTLTDSWSNDTESLNDLIQINQAAKRLQEIGLRDFFNAIVDWKLAGEHLVDFFNRNWYEQLIIQAQKERTELREFDGVDHNEKIEKFRQQDRQILDDNRYRIISQHAAQLEKLAASGVGQVGLLRSELARKRGQKSLRKLLAEAPNAIQKLKPVFMMSPMSIATFLEPGKIQFDLVVFDEASQIRPSDALGAILRGKQTVVVGDSKQMPPSSFFNSIGGSTDEDDEDGSLSDYESILGLFNSKGANNHMLRWHYRSRHESLIAVSNQEFYDSKLLIAPSAISTSELLGLKYRYLPDTHYQRGAAINHLEAIAVAKAVIQHAENHPTLTLGVVAFSMSQMQAVRDELETLRRQRPDIEDFFNAHPNEPFFTKNLENVQGDERDVIYISIGYGKTRDGKLSMGFGPLNGEGGERRLNVLISRARLRCEVFTNLKAADLDLSRTNSVGVQAFKAFLQYAETGSLDIAKSSDREPDSPFELSVADSLKALGYRVEHQIGTSGFFIDLAIVDEANPGSYLVGIECDGASYHSSTSARDRDRLRQGILESKGWKILRVWSTDWFNNPVRELQRLQTEIERAKTITSQPSQSAPAEKTPQPPLIVRQESKSEPTITTSYAIPYKLAHVSSTSQAKSIAEVPQYELRRLIEWVVTVESPIHADELVRRVARALGFERATTAIRQAVLTAAKQIASIRITGNFLDSRQPSKIQMRDRSDLPAESRKIEYVAPEEIRDGILTIIRASLGDVPLNDLTREVRTALGFGRTTKDIETVIAAQVRWLIEANHLEEEPSDVFRLS